MKNLLFLALIAITAFTSCKKDNWVDASYKYHTYTGIIGVSAIEHAVYVNDNDQDLIGSHEQDFVANDIPWYESIVGEEITLVNCSCTAIIDEVRIDSVMMRGQDTAYIQLDGQWAEREMYGGQWIKLDSIAPWKGRSMFGRLAPGFTNEGEHLAVESIVTVTMRKKVE